MELDWTHWVAGSGAATVATALGGAALKFYRDLQTARQELRRMSQDGDAANRKAKQDLDRDLLSDQRVVFEFQTKLVQEDAKTARQQASLLQEKLEQREKDRVDLLVARALDLNKMVEKDEQIAELTKRIVELEQKHAG